MNRLLSLIIFIIVFINPCCSNENQHKHRSRSYSTSHYYYHSPRIYSHRYSYRPHFYRSYSRFPHFKHYHRSENYSENAYTTPGEYGPVLRDANGRIHRSSSARHEFMNQTGFPHGRKGYIIDHIIPLKKGGCDCPENMQWQTIEEAKEKDKWE